MTSRRDFLHRAGFALLPVALSGRGPQDSLRPQGKPPVSPGAAAADTLAIAVGRPSAPLGPLDNDPGVIAIERRLRCTCGCTLDVYTCRTTDFSCTYSPAMHKDVVARVQHGDAPDAIVQWFVAQDGEKVLMAPEAHGFNLMGYLVPGLTVTAIGLALVAWLIRRRPVLAPAEPSVGNDPAGNPATPRVEELDRLRRALDDVES